MSSWSNTAEVYENPAFVTDYSVRNLENELVKSLVHKFVKQLESKDLVLDLGCGHGRDVRYLFDEGVTRVIGLDFSQQFIVKAGKLTDPKKYPHAEFRVEDMRDLSFQNDETVDGIWCCASLICLDTEDAKIALTEMYRVLKPNGKVFLGMKCGAQGPAHFTKSSIESKTLITHQLWEKDQLTSLLRSIGFQVENWGIDRNAKAGENEVCWTNFLLRKSC